jgi:hypothetical protein
MIIPKIVYIIDEDFNDLLKEAVNCLYSKNNTQQCVPKDHAIKEFTSLAKQGYCLYLKDTVSNTTLYAMVSENNTTPHYVGKGLAVNALITSANNPALIRFLLKWLIAEAKYIEHSWVWYTHQIQEGVYKSTYRKIDNG